MAGLTKCGQGANGVVYKKNMPGGPVAIKLVDADDVVKTLREIYILHLLRDVVNVVKLLRWYTPPQPNAMYRTHILIVTDFYPKTLFTYLGECSVTPLENGAVVKMFRELSAVMAHVHARNVVHRDIKCDNILVAEDGTLVLCDFGLARLIDDDAPLKLSTNIITRYYRPPEVLMRNHYTQKADVWSMLCVFAEILRKSAPVVRQSVGPVPFYCPLFRGRTSCQSPDGAFEWAPDDQLFAIMRLLGTPRSEAERMSHHKELTAQIRDMDPSGNTLPARFPGAEPALLAVLEAGLVFDPTKRPTAAELVAMVGGTLEGGVRQVEPMEIDARMNQLPREALNVENAELLWSIVPVM
jgi:serine/threonine protein kinase